MSQPQANITIAAPGFAGINTEISPTIQADQYAAIAENCIIDEYGRLGSRKGMRLLSTDATAIGGAAIQSIHAHLDVLGVETVLCAADNKIFKGLTTPVDATPVGATITGNDWQMTSFNDDCFMFQEGHTVLQYDASIDTVVEVAGIPEGSCATAAYGRLWVAGVAGSDNIVHWSALLDGTDFVGGDTGTINVEEYWPTGYDTIVGMKGHNDRLIIFGKENILVFTNVTGDIAGTDGIRLEDAVRGIGCMARRTIVGIGTDVLFLDRTGLRSLGRTLTQTSLPIGDVSQNVASAVTASVNQETAPNEISAIYSAAEALYLLIFRTSGTVFCFSTRQPEQTGAFKTTTWPVPTTGAFAIDKTGGLLIGGSMGLIGQYDGYDDLGESYKLRYFTNPLSFGDSTKLKFPKQVDFTLIVGSSGDALITWAFDYGRTTRSRRVVLAGSGNYGFYNEAEFNEVEYSGGNNLVRRKANIGGSGVVVSLGIELDILGDAFSIQEINIQTLIGRIT